MTAQALNTPNPAPDTEVRVISVIVDLMLSLNSLLDCCDQAEEAGGNFLSTADVRRIASGAVLHAKERAQPTPAGRMSDSELSRRIADEMARRSTGGTQ